MFASRLLRTSRPLIAGAAASATMYLATADRHADNAASWFSSKPKIHIKYFKIDGVASTLRHTLALGGAEWTEAEWEIDFKKIDSKDIPNTLPMASPGFGAAKAGGELVANLNRAPVVIIDGATFGQSKSIERYLARRLGLMGKSEEEACQIDAVTEHIRDVKDAYKKAKDDANKDAAVAKFFSVTMPAQMKKIDEAVAAVGGGKGAPLIGTSLSLADVTLFIFVVDFFDNKEGAAASIKGCQRLEASIKAVSEHPSIVKYRASKGK